MGKTSTNTALNRATLAAYAFFAIAGMITLAAPAAAQDAPAISADSVPLPASGIGTMLPTRGFSFGVGTENDSCSIPGKTDWDDLRSYGGNIAVSWRQWAFVILRDGLTDRAESESEAKRIDETYVAFSREIVRLDAAPLSLSASAGAGFLALGNFSEYLIQWQFHAMIGNRRPIPTAYDAALDGFIAVAHGLFRIALETPIIPVGFSGAFEAGHDGFVRGSAFASAQPVSGFASLSLWSGGRFSANQERGGSVFAKTVESENGLLAGMTLKIGAVGSGVSYNVTTGRPDAWYSVEFRKGEGDRERASRGTSRFDGQVDMSLLPLNASYRLRATMVPRPIRIAALAGFDCGTITTMRDVAETELYRFDEYYAGIDASVRAAGFVEPYAMGAVGARREQFRTRLATASKIRGERMSPVGIFEGGVRCFVPAGKQKGSWGVGFGGGATVSDAYKKGLSPYAQIRLVGVTR